MYRKHDLDRSSNRTSTSKATRAAPGKRTLTEQLAPWTAQVKGGTIGAIDASPPADRAGFFDLVSPSGGPAAAPIAQDSDLAALTGGESTETASSSPRTHVVAPGQQLAAIAATFGITVDALKAANPTALRTWKTSGGGTVQGFDAGDIIVIPTVPAAPAATPAPAPAPGLLNSGAAVDQPPEPAPAPAAAVGPAATPFFSQLDNQTGKDGAETIGQSNRVSPGYECNVTTLAMQLVGIAGDTATVNRETMTKLAAAGKPAPEADVTAQPEDLLLRLFIAWGDAYWKKICEDSANRSFFPDMDVGVSFYDHYSDPSRNTHQYGWHQIGQCLAWVGQLYSFVAKTGSAGYDEQKVGKGGTLSHDPTDAHCYQELKPRLEAGAMVMLSTRLTGGHIIMLVGVDDAGIWVNDPYGVKIGGPASDSEGYILNGTAANTSRNMTTYAGNIPVRFQKNPALLAIANDEAARAEPQSNWGERNYYTFDEVKTYRIGKWNSVLEKTPAAD